MNPPENSIVICIDEDGPLSVRPYSGSSWAKSGYPKRIPARYTRTQGVIQMVGAFNPHDGIGFAKCYDVKNSDTILDFLSEVERHYPDMEIHIVWDNLSAHKKAQRLWKHYNPDSLFKFHYTPSNASWLNLIEPWSGTINRRALNNSDYKTREAMIIALYQAMFYSNANAKPYKWKKTEVA